MRQLLIMLGAVILVTCCDAQQPQASDKTVEEFLARIVHMMAPSLPKPLDSYTRLDAVEAGDRLLVLLFTVTIPPGSASLTSERTLFRYIQATQQKLYNTNPNFAFFKDHGVTLICDLSDKGGGHIGETEVGVLRTNEQVADRFLDVKKDLSDDDIKKTMVILQQSVQAAIEAINNWPTEEFSSDDMTQAMVMLHPRLAAIDALNTAGTLVNEDTVGETMRRQAAVATDRAAAWEAAHPEPPNIDLSDLEDAPKPLDLSLLEDALTPHATQSSPTTEARNKAIATRVFEEIFNQGRFEVANEIYTPDFKNHGLHRSVDLKTDQDAVHAEKHSFPDLRMQIERLIAEGDWVTALWTFRGTHTAGGYAGLPATGTPIEMRGITIWRIVDGKIRDEWSSFDELGAYSQVVRHVQAKLWLGFGVILVLIIAAERLLWVGFKRLVSFLRHKSSEA